MKIWFKAVCDEHKEMCNVFVHNTYNFIETYLDAAQVIAWLTEHGDCHLRLIHQDEELAECFDRGYVNHNCFPPKPKAT